LFWKKKSEETSFDFTQIPDIVVVGKSKVDIFLVEK